MFSPRRCQRDDPGDRAAQGAGPGPAQADSNVLHCGAALPPGAGIPALPVRGGPGKDGASEATQPLRDTGETPWSLGTWWRWGHGGVGDVAVAGDGFLPFRVLGMVRMGLGTTPRGQRGPWCPLECPKKVEGWCSEQIGMGGGGSG